MIFQFMVMEKNIRDWIYVLDHCEAAHEVSERGTVGERYNIGGECEITNLDLTKKILDIMNISHDIIKFVPDILVMTLDTL